jgi:hypothetical protein
LQHCDQENQAAWQLYRELGYRRVALEAPWAPYLNGRPPNRCWLLVKRLPSDLVEAARRRQQEAEREQQQAAAAAAAAAQCEVEPELGRQGSSEVRGRSTPLLAL